MGRNALPDEQKRKQVAVRISPRDRERLARQAEAHGSSVGAEVEQLALDQLAYIESVDAETRELVAAIVDEIAAIQGRMKKRWHKDLATWAAVAEMLRVGPIMDRNPDDMNDDQVVTNAWSKLWNIEQSKRKVVEALKALGISVSAENPKKQRPRKRGLLGFMSPAVSFRDTEQAAIDALPDGPDKNRARGLFTDLLRLDEGEYEADQQCTEARQPYWDERSRGRNEYREHLRARAARLRDEGKPHRLAHLLGWFD